MGDNVRNTSVDVDRASFVALVLSDEEWLRAEFDAIVEVEEWGDTSSPGSRLPMASLPAGPDREDVPGHAVADQPRSPATPARPGAPERSPPTPWAQR